eukprot:6890705-Alexandrium_andersonii.AAC.1
MPLTRQYPQGLQGQLPLRKSTTSGSRGTTIRPPSTAGIACSTKPPAATTIQAIADASARGPMAV